MQWVIHGTITSLTNKLHQLQTHADLPGRAGPHRPHDVCHSYCWQENVQGSTCQDTEHMREMADDSPVASLLLANDEDTFTRTYKDQSCRQLSVNAVVSVYDCFDGGSGTFMNTDLVLDQSRGM